MMDNNNNFDVTKHIHCAFIYYSMAFREIILENKLDFFFCLLVDSHCLNRILLNQNIMALAFALMFYARVEKQGRWAV